MPHFCAMDNAWPKKRCYIRYDPRTGSYKCRHWNGLKAIGCGIEMWCVKAKDGDKDLWNVIANQKYTPLDDNNKTKEEKL